MRWIQNSDRRFFMRHTVRVVLVHIRHGEWVRSDLQVSDFVAAVVLRNECSPTGNIIQKAFVVRAQVITNGVGTNAENYSSKLREIGCRNVFRRQDGDIDSQLPQR